MYLRMLRMNFFAAFVFVVVALNTVLIFSGVLHHIFSGKGYLFEWNVFTPLSIIIAAYSLSNKTSEVKKLIGSFCMAYTGLVFFWLSSGVLTEWSSFYNDDGSFVKGKEMLFIMIFTSFLCNAIMVSWGFGRMAMLFVYFSMEDYYKNNLNFLKILFMLEDRPSEPRWSYWT